MHNPIVVIEISPRAAKLLIGYTETGKPIVAYSRVVPLSGQMRGNQIVDEVGLSDILKQFRHTSDAKVQTEVNINQAAILLPNDNLTCYRVQNKTATISRQVVLTDVTNVIALASKEVVAAGEEVADVIPLQFTLENGESYAEPPIGKVSTDLAMQCLVYTLPSQTKTCFTSPFGRAGINVYKAVPACYAAAKYLSTLPGIPDNYLLVDIGARSTSITAINRHMPIRSLSFTQGGDDLTEQIAETYGLTIDFAEEVKREFGYDARERTFKRAIFRNPRTGEGFTQESLNSALKVHTRELCTYIKGACSEFAKTLGDRANRLPLVIIGGGSKLRGLEALLASELPGRTFIFARPDTLGARDPSLVGLLGLIMSASTYVGSLEDSRQALLKTEQNSEGAQKGKKSSARRSADPDADAL